MKKFREIGGLFSDSNLLYDNSKTEVNAFLENKVKAENHYYLAFARQAITLILEYIGGNLKVLMPVFTCESVIEPFINNNCELSFYSISNDLTIDERILNSLIKKESPNILFLHSYFGINSEFKVSKILNDFRKNGGIVINDLTQSILSSFEHVEADYYIGSIRKWAALPDGAFLFTNEDIKNNTFSDVEDHYIDTFIQASSKKEEYKAKMIPETKDMFRHLFDLSKLDITFSKVERMSYTSKNQFNKLNFEEIRRIRVRNYKFLNKNINSVIGRCIADNEVPLYFPISCCNREALQKRMASEEVYAPIIWPKSSLIHKDDSVHYRDLLAIPCDQRYTLKDMERIVILINEFNNAQ